MTTMTFSPASLLIEVSHTAKGATLAKILRAATIAGVTRFAYNNDGVVFGPEELCANDVDPAEYAEWRESWVEIMTSLAATTARYLAEAA